MFTIDTAAKAKKSARALEKALAKQGIKLVHGHALNAVAAMSGFEDWNGMQECLQRQTPEVSAPVFGKVPNILDLDFSQVSSLRRGEVSYLVDAQYYADRLAWVKNWDDPKNPNDPDIPVLRLTFDGGDGFIWNRSIQADELLSLKWEEKLNAFVSPDGVLYQFFTSQPVGPDNLPQSDASATLEQQRQQTVTAPQVYHVRVYAGRAFVGEWWGAAPGREEATREAYSSQWDDRLNCTGKSPRYKVEVLDDSENGFFSIRDPKEHTIMIDYSHSFRETWKRAKEMNEEAGGHSGFQIIDAEDRVIFTFK
jgi:hypothetical protein